MTDVRLTATNPVDSSVVPVACNAKGELKLEEPIDNSFDGNLDGDLTVTGKATTGNFEAKGTGVFTSTVEQGNWSGGLGNLLTSGYLFTRHDGGGAGNACFAAFQGGAQDANIVAVVKYDGSATFAGGKAGFTAEGYLWCTDSRNATWMLDFISNGMPQWVQYTPPSRKAQLEQEVEEKLEEWSEKDKPSET